MAKPLRLALGACIIQAEYGCSDEETARQIQDNPYLQHFCGYSGYADEKLPFDPSLMVHFRKRMTPEVLGEINEMILRDEKEHLAKEDGDDDAENTRAGAETAVLVLSFSSPILTMMVPHIIQFGTQINGCNVIRSNLNQFCLLRPKRQQAQFLQLICYFLLFCFHSSYASCIHTRHGRYPAEMAVSSSRKNTRCFTYFPLAIYRRAEGQSSRPYILSFLWPPIRPGISLL